MDMNLLRYRNSQISRIGTAPARERQQAPGLSREVIVCPIPVVDFGKKQFESYAIEWFTSNLGRKIFQPY